MFSYTEILLLSLPVTVKRFDVVPLDKSLFNSFLKASMTGEIPRHQIINVDFKYLFFVHMPYSLLKP